MPVPTAITDLSATIASNSPAGGDTVFPELDNYLRAAFGFIRQGDAKASDVASATTTDLGAAAGRIVDVTGTTTITSFGTVAAGVWRIVRFTGALTLTHNATSLILPGSANITTAAGDCLIAVSLGSGNWFVASYQRDPDLEVESALAGMPKFAARLTSGSVTVNDVVVVFNTESFDIGAGYNASTGVFTAPSTGYYYFDARAYVIVGATGVATTVTLAIRKNGTTVIDESFYGATDNKSCYLNPTGLISLTAGDTVDVYAQKSPAGGSASIWNGGFGPSRFQGWRVS